jgi:hypothetical protein
VSIGFVLAVAIDLHYLEHAVTNIHFGTVPDDQSHGSLLKPGVIDYGVATMRLRQGRNSTLPGLASFQSTDGALGQKVHVIGPDAIGSGVITPHGDGNHFFHQFSESHP